MAISARAVRKEEAKAIGRIAYRLARDATIFGNLDIEGETKRLTEYRRGRLLVELWRPLRADAAETEFSRLRISDYGRRLFEVRWDGANRFKVVVFEPGDWEVALRNVANYL